VFLFTIVDDHSRYTWIFLMNNQVETRNGMFNFINLIHNQFDIKLKPFRFNDIGEFAYTNLYNNLGIIHKK